jgi:hypothetical protein
VSQPDQPAAFIPPAAEGLPLGVLDSATDGASALDAWAREPVGRNFLAHALVQLARDGWLRTEPGEGFETVRDRETPEPEDPAGLSPAADRAAVPAAFVVWLDASDGSVPTHDGVRWPDGRATLHHRHFGYTTTHADPEAARQAAHGKQGRLVWPEPAPADRAAVLREAADAIDRTDGCGCGGRAAVWAAVATLRRMADETQQPETETHGLQPKGARP